MSFVFVLVFSTAISNVLLIIFLCFQMLAINTFSFVVRLVFVVCNGALELINYLYMETPQIRSLQIQTSFKEMKSLKNMEENYFFRNNNS